MGDYCTVAQVSRFMTRKVINFDANTLLTATDVEDVIDEQEDYIDDVTQTSWKANVVTNELLDANFSDKWRWHGDYIVYTSVHHPPIRSIERLAVWQGNSLEVITGSGPDRAGGTWYKFDKLGAIYLIGTTIPAVLRNSIEVDYTWGETVVPKSIRDACIRLTAASILESESYAVQLPEASASGYAEQLINRFTREAEKRLDLQRRVSIATSGG